MKLTLIKCNQFEGSEDPVVLRRRKIVQNKGTKVYDIVSRHCLSAVIGVLSNMMPITNKTILTDYDFQVATVPKPDAPTPICVSCIHQFACASVARELITFRSDNQGGFYVSLTTQDEDIHFSPE